MKFVTDGFSLTGVSHIPKGLGCQDYTTHGVIGSDAAYAIVCDGSSCADANTGEPDRTAKTGLGAAVLGQITQCAITGQPGITPCDPATARAVISAMQFSGIKSARALLGLSPSDMLATCLYALVSPQGGFVSVQGDGVLALRYTDGVVHAIKWGWAKNMPYYPAYRTDDNLEGFVAQQGGWEAAAVTEEQWQLVQEQEPVHLNTRGITVREGVEGVCLTLTAEQMARLESITLFSDGICSVAKGSALQPQLLDWRAMVARMFVRWGHALPNFAMVRLDRWQQRDCQTLGAAHLDDLSIAAIRRAP